VTAARAGALALALALALAACGQKGPLYLPEEGESAEEREDEQSSLGPGPRPPGALLAEGP